MTSAQPVRIDTGANKDIAVAYAFWLFLGIFGGHRFYVGKIGTGVLWFLTFGLFMVGWMVDVFLVPGMVRRANTVGYLR